MTETYAPAALLRLIDADTVVPLTDGRTIGYANLDGAASASALQIVADRVAEILPLYASVHRGAGYLSQVSTTIYESSRGTIGSFVGARDDDVTIITRNTTDSINLLAGAVPPGVGGPGRVLILDVEHHANFLPWQRSAGGATVLRGADSAAATLTLLRNELASSPYALLAITGASNVTGESLPLDALTRLAHDHGARIFVDAAQLIPHRRFSLSDSDVDYVAFSGHKLYAPYGAGALVGRRDWLDEADPYLAGGGAVTQVGVANVVWNTSPARHEAGSPNVIGAAALAAACEAISDLPEGSLVRHESDLRRRLIEGLESIAGLRIARLWPDAGEPTGVVTFALADHNPGLVAAYLSAEHGIGVRDGRFCAHPLLSRLGLDSGAIRASIGVGTTDEHVDRLIDGLRAFVDHGPQSEYVIADGCWVVDRDPRPIPQAAGISELVATAAAACGPAPTI